jgi:hypothetical protein
MNPTEFQVSRDSVLKTFETSYSNLKTQYSTALQNAKSETDRPKQCVLIKSALDANKQLTTLVEDFVRLNTDGGCKLTPDKIQSLQKDIEKYKEQHAEIQQGKDRVFSLEKSFQDTDLKAIHADGINVFYFILIGLGVLVLVGLIFRSGINRTFNAQPISPVIPRGFT